MSTLQMLDVAIGIVFTFLLLSLICTALGEIAEKYLKFRSTDLERGIRELLLDTLEDAKEIKKIKDAESKLDQAVNGDQAKAKEKLVELKHEFALKRDPEKIKATEEQLKNTNDEAQKALKQAELEKLIDSFFDKNSGIVPALYQHSLISGLYRGPYETKGRNLPAYIPASNFALAILDLALPAGQNSLSGSAGGGAPVPSTTDKDAQGKPIPPVKSLEPLREAILSNSSGVLTNPALRRGLLTLVDSAGNDIDKARKNIENWFNTSMDRVSGWYKRRTQGILVVMGLLLAIAMNADTIAIYKGLQNDPPLRNALVAASQEYAKAPPSSDSVKPEDRVDNNAIKLYNLRLPIGWDWDTTSYSKKDTSKKAAAKTDADPVTKVARKTTADSLKRAIDSLTKRTDSLTKVAAKKADIDSLKNETASLKKLLAKAVDIDKAANVPKIAPAPREITKEEYLSNRKLALPWYYESAKREDASFWDILKTKGFWLKMIGWLITALAVSLGAPFWFDTLNKIMVIRSTVKPHEKSPEEDSEDRQKNSKS